MNKKHFIIFLFSTALSACGDSVSEEGASQDSRGFFQNIVEYTQAFFKDEQDKQEPKDSGKTSAILTQNPKKPLPEENHLSRMMANQRTSLQSPNQKTEQEELEQSRRNYAQAVDVNDKVDALAELVQVDEDNAVAILKEAYASPEPLLRKEAVLQMQDFTDKKEVVDLLLQALNDADPGVVMEAIEGLSAEESKQVMEGLKKVAKSHPDETVRELAQDYVDQGE